MFSGSRGSVCELLSPARGGRKGDFHGISHIGTNQLTARELQGSVCVRELVPCSGLSVVRFEPVWRCVRQMGFGVRLPVAGAARGSLAVPSTGLQHPKRLRVPRGPGPGPWRAARSPLVAGQHGPVCGKRCPAAPGSSGVARGRGRADLVSRGARPSGIAASSGDAFH